MKSIEQALGGPRDLSVIFDVARIAEMPPSLVDNPRALSVLGRRHIGYWPRLFQLFLLYSSHSFGRFWFTMGKKFGALARGKNIVTYSLSPFEQRAFAGITKSIANMARRVRSQLPYQLPAFITGILIYTWANEDFRKRNRKNPKDFENDE